MGKEKLICMRCGNREMARRLHCSICHETYPTVASLYWQSVMPVLVVLLIIGMITYRAFFDGF